EVEHRAREHLTSADGNLDGLNTVLGAELELARHRRNLRHRAGRGVTHPGQQLPTGDRGRYAARVSPRHTAGQRWIMSPEAPCSASMTASPRVGCAKTTRESSSAVKSQVCAALSTGSISVTSGPIRWAPMISLCSASAT